ncbi:MAG: arylsulfatase A-like enzyme, partial [Saprospiraceae bacterium]
MFTSIFLSFLLLGSCNLQRDEPEKPNIIFIAIDDMNDWTGFLNGHPQAITPNMDKMAQQGVNFTNAHCIAPACGPSRNALLFGIEPHRSGLYPFYNQMKMDQTLLNQFTSLPQFFKESGYATYGSGKIHHGREWTFIKDSGKREWTENNQNIIDALPALVFNYKEGFGVGGKMAFCPTDSPLEHHPDYVTAQFGMDILKRDHDKPFFLALGFVKPHLPFVCPKEYFDLYPDPILPPAIKGDDLVDIPWAGRSNAKIGDDLKYRQDDKWQKVHRSYLACNSWTDANIGRVMDKLNNSEYKDNTIIVLLSDHGYHQGEKRSFRKFSLWEEATRVPFIIIDPRNEYKGNCK